MCEKSPISILQEQYVKRGLLPLYTSTLDGNGLPGQFTMKVEVDGLSAVGSGSSKKQAKHNAAVALLKQLNMKGGAQKRPAEAIESQVESQGPKVAGLNSPVRPNFVGKLQEYMMKRKCTIPKYEVVSEEGPPHMRQFTMCCIVKDMKEVGTARSKQEAKNIAAEKFWEKLECDGDPSDSTKAKRRKLVDNEKFDEVLKQFRSVMDEIGGSFAFTEEISKEYAVDKVDRPDDFSNYKECDRKMFSFLGTRSFTALLPEKSSIILNIDTGTESRAIGARGWTRQDAMYKALKDGVEYLSKLNFKTEKNGDNDSQSDAEA